MEDINIGVINLSITKKKILISLMIILIKKLFQNLIPQLIHYSLKEIK